MAADTLQPHHSFLVPVSLTIKWNREYLHSTPCLEHQRTRRERYVDRSTGFFPGLPLVREFPASAPLISVAFAHQHSTVLTFKISFICVCGACVHVLFMCVSTCLKSVSTFVCEQQARRNLRLKSVFPKDSVFYN